MPQILSVSRLKGSAYRAKDFIVGEGREKFQNDLTEALAKAIEEKHIIAVSYTHLDVYKRQPLTTVPAGAPKRFSRISRA